MTVERLDACAERVRDLEAELADARAALEVAIRENGWSELSRHSVAGSGLPAAVTYLREGGTAVDAITGQPCGAQVATLAAFIEGSAP